MLFCFFPVLLLISGAFVNGPYGLITTAVSADLGTHESIRGNAKALSTVTAMIDGTGSIGEERQAVVSCSYTLLCASMFLPSLPKLPLSLSALPLFPPLPPLCLSLLVWSVNVRE